MLRTLEDLARSSGRLTLVQADAQRLLLRDDGVDVALAMHMLYHVPDVPAAVAELRRIVKPGGTLLASTNCERGMAEVNDLFGAAVANVLGRPVRPQSGNSFTTETGAAVLATAFSDMTLHQHELPLAIPSAEPVVTYLDSLREPVLRSVGEPLDFDAVLGLVAARVEEVIRERGTFRAVNRSGVFVCR